MTYWNQIRKGDDRAFRCLYNDHADLLFAFGLKIVSDESLIYECIQDLFVYVFEARMRISEPVSMRAYLCVALKRILLKSIYQNKRKNEVSWDDIKQEAYSFDLEIDIETAIIKSEMQREELYNLQQVLNDLSPQQREVIYLKYNKNCTNEEISEILGVSNQIVRNVSSRALIKLRKFGNIRAILLCAIV